MERFFKEVPHAPGKREKQWGAWNRLINEFIKAQIHVAVIDYAAIGKTARQAYNGLLMAVRRSYKEKGISVLWRSDSIYIVNEKIPPKKI